MNELTSEVAEVTCNGAKECDGPEFEEDAAALLPGPSGSVDASVFFGFHFLTFFDLQSFSHCSCFPCDV